MRQLPIRLPDAALARRPTFDRRPVRPGEHPSRQAVGSRAMSRETWLKRDFLQLMTDDPTVASVVAHPESFSWRDGVDGRRHVFAPDCLVLLKNGSRIYRSVRAHASLLRDPELSGRRTRIELECAVRGGTFEVWTEREVRESTNGWSLLRVASARDAEDLERSLRETGEFGSPRPPSIVMRICEHLGLARPREVGSTFLARSHLTGVLMAVLCDLQTDPDTGALVWKPSPRRT